MDSAFVCEFAPTIKMCANRIRRLNPVRCSILMVVGICFFLYMTLAAVKFQFRGIWLMFFAAGVIYLLWSFFMPEINSFWSLRRYKKDTAGQGIYKVAFGDTIEFSEGNIRVIWEYSEINEVRHLKYTYELMKNKRVAITLDPDSFTQGTFEDFKQFLREKRPDLKIPE